MNFSLDHLKVQKFIIHEYYWWLNQQMSDLNMQMSKSQSAYVITCWCSLTEIVLWLHDYSLWNSLRCVCVCECVCVYIYFFLLDLAKQICKFWQVFTSFCSLFSWHTQRIKFKATFETNHNEIWLQSLKDLGNSTF